MTNEEKIEELTEFPLSGFCKTKSSELKAYLENKFPAQKKTSKWDDDNYKLIAWNYTAYWLCKEKSNRPEYTIEQLQKFFNKKSITEKLLEEAKLKYPVGTKIQKCLDGWSEDGETNIISGIPYNTVSGSIWVKGSKYNLCIYHNGRWAEIISLPEPEIETPKVEFDLRTTITRAVNSNNPNIIATETGKSIDELCKLVTNSDTRECLIELIKPNKVYCVNLSCNDCYLSIAVRGASKGEIISWLRSKQPNVEKIIDFQKQGRPIMDCSGSTTGVIVKNPTSNFSKQIDKTLEFLMLDSEVVEFQALPKRKPVSIQLIGID